MKPLSDADIRKLRAVGPEDHFAGRFAIVGEAGAGAMGTVYRANDAETGEIVALKILKDVQATTAARFEREVAAVSSVTHPGVVRYVAHGATAEGERWLATEWLDGETLARRVRRAPLSIAEAIGLGRAVAGALCALHERALVHRDLKPSNVFLCGGDAQRAKLLDLGLVRTDAPPARLTRTGAIVGTVGYMAPEQARGERGLDGRTDVFSLGCVLFRALSGRRPFDGDNAISVLGKLLLERPPSLRDLVPETPVALDALVARMLSKDKEDRPSALEVLAALEAIGSGSEAPATRSSSSVTGGKQIAAVMLVRAPDVQEAATIPLAAVDVQERALEELAVQLGATVEPLARGVAMLTMSGAATLEAATRLAASALERGALAGAACAVGAVEGDSDRALGAAVDAAADRLMRARPGEVRAPPEATAPLGAGFEVRRDGPDAIVVAEKAASAPGPRRRDALGWAGTVLDGRVAVETVVGEGGFGVVYRGKHLGFEEPVAIKCLKIPAHLDDEQREAFIREFRKEARLLHRLSRKTAGIVQALDVGAAVSPSGIWTPYIVMEWLEGRTLEQELATRAARGARARGATASFSLMTPAAEALAVAHEAGIAHLDVKPGNLFLVDDGGEVSMKVVDFGIARALATSGTLTRRAADPSSPVSAFTPQYAAPEQFNARHGVASDRTDVFALALVFLEVATGRPALRGDTPLQLYVAAASPDARPSLAEGGVSADAAVEAVLRRALAVEPKDRWPDAGAFWAELGRALAESTTRAPAGASVAPPRDGSEPIAAAAVTASPTGHNRVCTVLVAEMGGRATGRALDPEQLAESVDRARDSLRVAIEQSGGEVYDEAGDRVIAAFGLRSETHGAAARAVHAALRMRRAMADHSTTTRGARAVRLKVRIGIDTGRVFVRSANSTTRRDTMTGAPVAAAARLALMGDGDSVLLGRDAHRQVAGQFEVEALRIPADADDPSGRAYRVLDVARAGAGGILVEREQLGVATRFVGRAAELEALAALADDAARSERARCAWVIGAPGVGQSRLVWELAARLETDGFVVLSAGASPLAAGSSYALAADLLRARFQVHEDDSREAAADKLRRGVAELRTAGARRSQGSAGRARRPLRDLMDAAEIADILVRALGYGQARVSGDLSAQESGPIERRIAAAFAAMLGSAAGPLAIVIDDAHVADDASLDLLLDSTLRLADRPVVLVCAGHAPLLERRPPSGDAEVVRLRPLSPGQLEEMASDRLRRVADLPFEIVRRIAERAEGWPLILTETIHLLVDSGAIDATDRERWAIDPTRIAELTELPPTIQGIVQARIDRLGPREQRLVMRAAVIGRVFWDGALATLEDEADAATTNVALAELSARGILRRMPVSTFPDEQEYAFAERVIHEVAYAMLGHAARRELHGKVATWLSSRAASEGAAILLARHYDKAALLDRALFAYGRAGAHAAALGQNGAALEAFERALRIDEHVCGETDADAAGDFAGWDPRPEAVPRWSERVRLRVDLGDVLRRTGDLTGAEARYEDARRRLVRGEQGSDAAHNADRWEARIDFRLSLVCDVLGRASEARASVERALGAAERGGLVEERGEMFAHLAATCLRERRIDAAKRACREGIAVLRPVLRRTSRWREAVAWLMRTLGGAFFHEQRMVRAERCYLQAARLLDERLDPYGVARVINNVAAVRFGRGDLASARDAFRRALELSERSGDLFTTMTALGNLGEVEHHLGRHDAARELLEEAVTLGERIGARAEVAECWRNLAVARLATSDAGGALQAAAHALAHARAGGVDPYREPILRTVAEICAATAVSEHAEQSRALAADLDVLAPADAGGVRYDPDR